ncbi:uncharacterized protein [Phaseolus vulgaris]|uniref:uncharacterized protein n=1 Tax=Phaseolus vulgaris TaxID=3885 RepID=UPI0035CA8555
MEATHVLLGRPGQFDRKKFHDGFTNKLSFDFHGHKVILKSLSPREVHEDQILMKKKRETENTKSSKNALLISSHAVNKVIVSHTPIFLAIPRPLELEKLEDSPHCLDNLVEEFHDVFQDPPKGLPPLRGIEHQIDLISGSSLPNRPAYRTNPSETREIRQ